MKSAARYSVLPCAVAFVAAAHAQQVSKNPVDTFLLLCVASHVAMQSCVCV